MPKFGLESRNIQKFGRIIPIFSQECANINLGRSNSMVKHMLVSYLLNYHHLLCNEEIDWNRTELFIKIGKSEDSWFFSIFDSSSLLQNTSNSFLKPL